LTIVTHVVQSSEVTRDTYIHGTEPGEQERLAALNRLTNPTFVRFLNIAPGMKVLEVGSGLGLLAAAVADAAERVQVLGVEKSPNQLAAAVNAPRVAFVRGDAHALAVADGSCDLVYARYLLEHVSDPVKVLSEMRRVARPGGRVAVCENDVSLLRLDPPCPIFERVWAAFQRHQNDLGGDSLIGQRLYQLFKKAGFSRIELSVQPEVHWHGSPGFPSWIQNIIGNVESARDGLIRSGLCGEAELEQAIVELSALLPFEDASSTFVWNRAVARR
jgi:ubiquinone/menaquinone biosynthesis C-methylase UbiE